MLTRRTWLPYAVWTLIAAAILLIIQPRFSYCSALHPRLCANALLADVASGSDAEGLIAVGALLGIGWGLIAAGRVLGRRVGVALTAWTAAAGLFFTFGYGGRMQLCLGPLDVTDASCRIALGLPPETDLDRFLAGPGPLAVMLGAGWLAIVLVTRWTKRHPSTGGRSVEPKT